MKTRGIEIVSGSLVLTFGWAVPVQFWNRLKAELQRQMLLDAFMRDYQATRDTLGDVPSGCSWGSWPASWKAEEDLFRRWVLRVFKAPPLWPWERGWTPDLVDGFLATGGVS